MIPDKLHDLVPLYVLGELDEADRLVFETALARSPELQSLVRATNDAFAAIAAETGSQAVAPPELWFGIERRARFEQQRARPPAAFRRPSSVPPRERSIWKVVALHPLWPAAAVLLLGLNLLQWFRSHPSTSSAPTSIARDDQRLQNRGPAETDATNPDRHDATSTSNAPAMNGAMSTAAPGAQGASVAAENQSLREENQRLATNYDMLANTVAPLLWPTVMEPGGAGGAWSQGMRRNEVAATIGLWERVRQLVPSNGLAALPDQWRLGGGVVMNPETWLGRSPANPAPTLVAPPPAVSAPLSTPFALVLLNREEGLGYLDLYNLPNVPAGHEMKVWLKNDNQAPYTSVGAVPPTLVGGSGALVFRVPPSQSQPAKVLITIEPVATLPQPTGPIVLEGP